MKPTKEQQAVIDLVAKSNKVKVNAVAGGGKTSVLSMVALSQQKPSLYIAFNKAMADEAKVKFPDHVMCMTAHSMAYRATGGEYGRKVNIGSQRFKLRKNLGQSSKEIVELFNIKDTMVEAGVIFTAISTAALVKRTVNNFEFSADKEITKRNIPKYETNKRIAKLESSDEFKETYYDMVVGHAKKLWDLRRDTENDIYCTHDTYLKVYQLSNPKLDYDVIYLDEAQDSNACLLDVVNNQKGKVVIVGDRYQSIYQWRGAVNAMDTIVCPESQLTHSFRYGQAVADIATLVLDGEMVVKGHPDIHTEVGYIPRFLKATKLYRTNAALMTDALDDIMSGIYVEIGINVQDFKNVLISLDALYRGDMKKVTHDTITVYTDWSDFMDYVQANDPEAKRLMTLHKKWIKDIENITILLDKYKKPKSPQYRYYTAHRSKGLEWDNVILGNDFPDAETIRSNDQERNLLYVAATRATKRLQINDTIQEMIEYEQGR